MDQPDVPVPQAELDRARALADHVHARLSAHRGTKSELAAPSFDIPPILYHYTTAEGILGILNAQAFWATSCDFLNDASEMRYALDLLNSSVRALSPQGELRQALYQQIFVDRVRFMHIPTFVVCFCKRGDLLSQWHGYAGGGGYAIGLSGTDVAAASSSNNSILWPVEYDEDRLRVVLLAHFESAAGAVEEVISECQSTAERDIVIGQASLQMLRSVAALAPRCKDPVFRGEEEWRVIRRYRWNERNDDLQFRVRGALIVPYISIELRSPQTGLLPIAEVVLGPTVDDVLARRSIVTLLQHKRSDAQVRFSQVPLRMR